MINFDLSLPLPTRRKKILFIVLRKRNPEGAGQTRGTLRDYLCRKRDQDCVTVRETIKTSYLLISATPLQSLSPKQTSFLFYLSTEEIRDLINRVNLTFTSISILTVFNYSSHKFLEDYYSVTLHVSLCQFFTRFIYLFVSSLLLCVSFFIRHLKFLMLLQRKMGLR